MQKLSTTENPGFSMGYGFLIFDSKESADKALSDWYWFVAGV